MFKMGGPTTKQEENKHQKVTKEFYSCLGFFVQVMPSLRNIVTSSGDFSVVTDIYPLAR